MLQTMFDKLFFILRLVGYIFSLTSQRLSLILSAKFHRLTYRSVPKPQDIVVIGGSFAGYFLARQLSESLPTGYRVVLIEKHSHFHFTWNFPRVTVLQGHEQNAFIPYPSKPQDAPEGAFLFRKGNVISIDADSVTLENGESIKYEYLVIATGSQKRYPATLDADEKVDGVKFFAKQQQAIKSAQKIVVVGGGAAGVEVAGDVKSKYPEKDVTLVHSREHLLNSFGEGLHTKVNPAFEELGIHLHLGQRVVSGLGQEGPGELTLKNGKTLPFDLLVRPPFHLPSQKPSPNSAPDPLYRPNSQFHALPSLLPLLRLPHRCHQSHPNPPNRQLPLSQDLRPRRCDRHTRSETRPRSHNTSLSRRGEHRARYTWEEIEGI